MQASRGKIRQRRGSRDTLSVVAPFNPQNSPFNPKIRPFNAFSFTSRLSPRYPSPWSPQSPPKSRSSVPVRPLQPADAPANAHYSLPTLFFVICTTWRQHLSRSQQLPHTSRRHGGCTPSLPVRSSGTPTPLLPITSLQ